MEDNNVTQSGKFSLSLGTMLMIAGVALSLLLIVLTFVNKQSNSLATMTGTIDETRFTQYDQRDDITGTQVVSLTKSWANEGVYVQVKAGSTYNVYYSGSDFSKAMTSADVRTITQGMSSKASKYYVNPSGRFHCDVEFNDKTDVLEGIVFTQI